MNVLKSVRNSFREVYLILLRKRLNNKNFTIIANNCVGGIIYHDLKQKFLSPTINLYMSHDDYYKYICNIKGYNNSILVEKIDDNIDYPVGEIEFNKEKILIYFQHYKDFATAKQKWSERVKRINYDNIYIIWDVGVDGYPKYYDLFKKIDFKNKALLHGMSSGKEKNTYYIPCYKKSCYNGEILEYQSPLSIRKNLNHFDYVKFLNKK